MTVKAIFDQLHDRVVANPAVADLQARYAFELTDAGDLYHATFEHGVVEIGEGRITNPDCTLTLAAADLLAVLNGELNPLAAFSRGRIKVMGQMALALKLQTMLA